MGNAVGTKLSQCWKLAEGNPAEGRQECPSCCQGKRAVYSLELLKQRMDEAKQTTLETYQYPAYWAHRFWKAENCDDPQYLVLAACATCLDRIDAVHFSHSRFGFAIRRALVLKKE